MAKTFRVLLQIYAQKGAEGAAAAQRYLNNNGKIKGYKLLDFDSGCKSSWLSKGKECYEFDATVEYNVFLVEDRWGVDVVLSKLQNEMSPSARRAGVNIAIRSFSNLLMARSYNPLALVSPDENAEETEAKEAKIREMAAKKVRIAARTTNAIGKTEREQIDNMVEIMALRKRLAELGC